MTSFLSAADSAMEVRVGLGVAPGYQLDDASLSDVADLIGTLKSKTSAAFEFDAAFLWRLPMTERMTLVFGPGLWYAANSASADSNSTKIDLDTQQIGLRAVVGPSFRLSQKWDVDILLQVGVAQVTTDIKISGATTASGDDKGTAFTFGTSTAAIYRFNNGMTIGPRLGFQGGSYSDGDMTYEAFGVTLGLDLGWRF